MGNTRDCENRKTNKQDKRLLWSRNLAGRYVAIGYVAILVSLLGSSYSYGQALRGTTGLLHAPTAEMQRDKTFMLGGNYLDKYPMPGHFHSRDVGYTFNYYLNITIFPWLEVGYTCTLVHADEGSTYFPSSVWGKFSNQDRAFNARLRLWKEGWWKSWTPQIVLGADDPGTHSSYGGGSITSGGDTGNNNYLTRYYLAATKHLLFHNVGELGIHAAFIIGNAMSDVHYKRPSLGANFRFALSASESWAIKMLNGLNLMAEVCPGHTPDLKKAVYDWNIGGEYHIWKDYINLVAELNDGKYFSGGVYFRVHLK